MNGLRLFRCRTCGDEFRRHPGRCPLCSWVKRVRDEFRALVEHGEEFFALTDLDADRAWLPSQTWTLRALGGRAA